MESPISITTAHIKHKIQLTKENLELIFKSYFKNDAIKIESIDEDPNGVGPNAGFQSDITKLTLKLNNMVEPLRIIIKEPILGSIFQKIFFRALKPFMRETFWYMVAVPGLSEEYPEVLELSPKCYHSITGFGNDYE